MRAKKRPALSLAAERAIGGGTERETRADEHIHHNIIPYPPCQSFPLLSADRAWHQVIDQGIAIRRKDLIHRFKLHQATVAMTLDGSILFVMLAKPGAARFMNAWQCSHPDWMIHFALLAGLPGLKIVFLEGGPKDV